MAKIQFSAFVCGQRTRFWQKFSLYISKGAILQNYRPNGHVFFPNGVFLVKVKKNSVKPSSFDQKRMQKLVFGHQKCQYLVKCHLTE